MRNAMAGGLLALLSWVPFAEAQQLDVVSATLGTRLQQSGRKAVAVVDFTDLQGGATELGRYLAEELSVMLASSAKGFTIIDRTHLKSILQEHKLGSTGVIDAQTARQLGKIAGVDTLITGTLTPFGDTIRLSAKALDSQTAGMLAATTADIPRTKAIEELLSRSVGGPGAASSRAITASATNEPALQRLQGAGIVWELARCHKSGTCQLFATAEDDTELIVGGGLGPGARAWDEAGNEYRVEEVRIGNRRGRADLVAGVRTPVTLTFEFSGRAERARMGAPGFGTGGTATRPQVEVESLTAVEIDFHGAGRRRGEVRFRNIPVR
jgi:TolB-like protein